MTSLSYSNPLDDFASYSVHYIMLATRSTSDAQDFTDRGKNADTLAAIDKVTLIGEQVPYQNSKSAFLIMDTRRFSQFTVEKLKYDINLSLTSAQSTTNFANYVEMTIIDSVGISFINFLQWLVNEKMQTNFHGIVFMLRVIFVGHHPDGSTETVQSVTLPLLMDKVELSLEFSKGIYNATFYPYTNFDAVQYRRWTQIGNATQFYTGQGKNTLGDVINSFEKRLNEQSEAYYNRARVLEEAARSERNTENKFGRVVRYQITIPQEWEGMEFTGSGTANATETTFQNSAPAKPGAPTVGKPGKPLDSHVNAPVGSLITDVLNSILKQVKGVIDLGSAQLIQGQGGSVTHYRHFVSLTSTDEMMMVHVDVVPFKVPNVYFGEKSSTIAVGQDDIYQIIDGVRVPKNYFELDYIFTGKNNQILNFDMKFQDLGQFLRTNLGLGADALEGITAIAQKGLKDPNQKIDTTKELVMARAFDPIMMPRSTEDELANFSRYSSQLMAEKGAELKKATQDYTRNLSMFYAASPMQVALTIKGNPLIMEKFNIEDFVPHTSTHGNRPITGSANKGPGSKAQYRREFEAQILKNNTTFGAAQSDFRQENGVFVVSKPLGSGSYTTSPVFFKINVNGPNVDYVTTETVHGEEFSKSVLYQNYYMVMTLSNVIEGGNFTQSMMLNSHNIYGYGKITSETSKEAKALK